MKEVHLSRDAYDRLRKEADWRSGERRDEISQWIERAREHGDIRENADFDAAKNEQGLNEGRIRQLEEMLRASIVVENAEGDVVAAGTIVEVRMDGDADTTEYLVGSIEERHDSFDVLSTSSPLGEALMGAAPGEIRSYKGPRRTFEVQVVSVRPLEG
jgi:transcription elongation factor GreA